MWSHTKENVVIKIVSLLIAVRGQILILVKKRSQILHKNKLSFYVLDVTKVFNNGITLGCLNCILLLLCAETLSAVYLVQVGGIRFIYTFNPS